MPPSGRDNGDTITKGGVGYAPMSDRNEETSMLDLKLDRNE